MQIEEFIRKLEEEFSKVRQLTTAKQVCYWRSDFIKVLKVKLFG